MEDLGLFVMQAGERGEAVRVPCAVVDPRFAAPFAAWRDLDRDFNGKPTTRGRHDWLDSEGIADSGTRGFFLDMWRAMQAEQGEFDEEKREAEEAQRQQQKH